MTDGHFGNPSLSEEAAQAEAALHEAVHNEATAGLIPARKARFIEITAALKDAEELVAPLNAELKAEIERITAEHHARHAEAYDMYNAVSSTAAECEKDLRESVIAHYKHTKSKTYDENLSVRVNTRLDYENDDAVEWAEKNAPVLIYRTVDHKGLEALAAKVELPFVTKIETPTAVIKGLK